jgi:hypothetical protein
MNNTDKLKADADYWRNLTDLLQYASLFLLIATMIILSNVPKAQAKVLVWYFVAVMFVLATCAVVVGHISIKKTTAYFKQRLDDISGNYIIEPTSTTKTTQAK